MSVKTRKKTGLIIVLGLLILFLSADISPVKAVDYLSINEGDKFNFTYSMDARDKNDYENNEEKMFLQSVKTSAPFAVEIYSIDSNATGKYSNVTYWLSYQINWTDSGQAAVYETIWRTVRINETQNKTVFIEQEISSPWDLLFFRSKSSGLDEHYQRTTLVLGNDTVATRLEVIWDSNGILKYCYARKLMNVTRESVYGGLMTMEIEVVITIAPKSQQVPGYSTITLLGCASFSVVVIILVIRKKVRNSPQLSN